MDPVNLMLTLDPDKAAVIVHVTPEQYATLQFPWRPHGDKSESPEVRMIEDIAEGIRNYNPDFKVFIQVAYVGPGVKAAATPSS